MITSLESPGGCRATMRTAGRAERASLRQDRSKDSNLLPILEFNFS